MEWNEKLSLSSHGDNYSLTGIVLHFHFAKLYLYTHVFRGTSSSATAKLSLEIDEFVRAAVCSATSILRALVTNREIQSQLDGLPTYFNTMIAFAVIFLLKIIMRSPNTTRIDNSAEIIELVCQVATVLNDVTSRMDSQHVLSSIASSIEKLVARFHGPSQSTNFQLQAVSEPGLEGLCNDTELLSPEYSMFLENYDLMFLQDGNANLDLFEFEQQL